MADLKKAEEDVLALSSFYPEGDGLRTGETLDVVIDDQGNHIHEFNVRNIGSKESNGCGDDTDENHIVLIHGYGAALGLFFKNFEDLTERPGTNLHALDLLGYGLSSRPDLPKFQGNTIEDVEEVESFFIEGVEQWRAKRGIEKFILIGHSLGGYLSSLYTIKHPQHVSKLVLISPVGVERSIYDLSIENRGDFKHVVEGPDVAAEIGKHHKDTDSEIKTPKDRNTEEKSDTKKSTSLHIPDANGFVTRVPNLPRLFTFMWNRNLSPFTIIRLLGPVGPKYATEWSFRRFGSLDDYSAIMKLHVYSYSTFVGRGSGEYALTRILAPGVLARYPLLERLPGVLKTKSLWLYGDVDWMSKEAGETIVRLLNKQDDGVAQYEIIKQAGHHVYLDNPADFKKSVFKFLNWE